MSKRKTGPGKRRTLHHTNKRNTAVIGGGLLIIIVITALFLNRVMKMYPELGRDKSESTLEQRDSSEQKANLPTNADAPNIFEADVLDRLGTLIAQARMHESPSAIPTGYVIPKLDFNADGNFAKLIAIDGVSPKLPARNLRRNGFDRVATEILVLLDERVLLHIDAFSMKNKDGTRILEQIPAPYGYAYRISSAKSDEIPFEQPVTLIHLILLDQNGEGISDEITLYWHPASINFRATNTFGAPGTY